MKMKQLTVAMITPLLTASCSEKQQDYPFRNPDLPLEERIDDLLSRLTPEEKIGQMMNVTPAIERLGIPTYDWWNEALHGVARAGRATVFPQAIAMAATFDDNAVHETFTMVSDEARAKYHQYQKDKEYDRLGLTEEYTEFLGNKVVCHSLPIRPGRNLAIIVESAAVNHRQKKMGYNAAQELYRRVQESINRNKK